MINIYILELTNSKYYIGRTTNTAMRIEDHFNNKGCEYTKKYKPIKVIEMYKDCDVYDEDKYVLKYMAKYGIDNVRGGSFSQIELDENEIEIINKMINNAENKCYNCGKVGHFINDCEENNIYVCEICEEEFNTEKECLIHETKCKNNKIICYKCGRLNHYANNCYAKKHINGYYLN